MQNDANTVDFPVNNDDLRLQKSMHGQAQNDIYILQVKTMIRISGARELYPLKT